MFDLGHKYRAAHHSEGRQLLMARGRYLSNSTVVRATCSAILVFFACLYLRDIFLAQSKDRLNCAFDRLCIKGPIKCQEISIDVSKGNLNMERRKSDNFTIPIEKQRNAGMQNRQFKKRLPNLLIIGVKKGGSKALLVFLGAHPKVRACRKEVHFFDEERNYHRGLKWYRNQMPESYSDEITVEKSPRYFVSGRTPKRVYRMSPDMKIVLILRDPLKRAISDYVHMKTRRQYFADENIETILWNNHTGEFNANTRFIQIGIYSIYLKNWLRYFPREQIHIVNGDNLIRDPGAELVKVQRFLNIEVLIDRNDFVFHSLKHFYCLVNRPGLNAPNHKEVICLGPSKGRKHPNISDKTRWAIRNFYRQHNQALYTLVGTDFGW